MGAQSTKSLSIAEAGKICYQDKIYIIFTHSIFERWNKLAVATVLLHKSTQLARHIKSVNA